MKERLSGNEKMMPKMSNLLWFVFFSQGYYKAEIARGIPTSASLVCIQYAEDQWNGVKETRE
ncbi:MAG: hypothetical protein HGA22_13420 [Clostridiales bacterium]|nr:hypothetical protein [Clostridiales bacterium]